MGRLTFSHREKIVLLCTIAVLLFAAIAGELMTPSTADCLSTQGTAVSSKVSIDSVVRGYSRSTFYTGELLLQYKVGDSTYRKWVKARIDDVDEGLVKAKVKEAMNARIDVRYYPDSPEELCSWSTER